MFDQSIHQLICDVCKEYLKGVELRVPIRGRAVNLRKLAKQQGWKFIQKYGRRFQNTFDVCPKCDLAELGL